MDLYFYFNVIEYKAVGVTESFIKQEQLQVLKLLLIDEQKNIYKDHQDWDYQYDIDKGLLTNTQLKFISYKVVRFDEKEGELKFRQCLMQQTLRKMEQTIRDGLGYYLNFDNSNETVLNGFDVLIREYQKYRDDFLEVYDPKNELKAKDANLLWFNKGTRNFK